jgi:hypothetical protein
MADSSGTEKALCELFDHRKNGRFASGPIPRERRDAGI